MTYYSTQLYWQVNFYARCGMEQCGICSTHYNGHTRPSFSLPDINHLILKLLDIVHPQVQGHSFYSQHIAVCADCGKKLHKYEKLRTEIDTLRSDFASCVIDTLVHIHPSEKTPLHSLRSQIMSRWVSKAVRADHPTPHILDHSPRKDRRGSSCAPQPQQEVTVHKTPANTNTSVSTTSSEGPSTPTLIKVGPGSWSWVDSDLSIVADSESEAQDILRVYVSGHVMEAEVQDIVDMEQGNGSFDLAEMDCFPDSAHVTIVTSNGNDADPPDECSDVNPKPPKKRRVARMEKSERRAMIFRRAAQHDKPPFFCEKCGRVYSKLSTLRIHVKTCNKVTALVEHIKCPICTTENVSTWLHLKFHIDEVHPDTKLDKCRFCKKEFLTSTMEGHDCVRPMSTEIPVLKTYSCDFCDKVYYKYTSLTEHVRRSHPSMNKFICSICHKQFVSKEAKENHERVHPTIPEGKRTHGCSVCGIVCTTAWGLREHTKLHTGARPYACEICGKTFRLQNIKRNHMVVHTKEKNFECEFCGRTYSLYATMYRHWKKCRVPSAPRKGRWCPICQEGGTLFQKLTSLKFHMLKKHMGTEEQYEICLENGNREFGFEATPTAHVKTEPPSNLNGRVKNVLPSTKTKGEDDHDSMPNPHEVVQVQREVKLEGTNEPGQPEVTVGNGDDLVTPRRSSRTRKERTRLN